MTSLTTNGISYKAEDGSTIPENHLSTPTKGNPNVDRILMAPINDQNSSSTLNKVNNHKAQEIIDSLQQIKDLDLFLVTAPVNWHENQVIRRYFLNKEEGFVSCVYWNNLYFITGTDIVRCIAYKMSHIGRQIVDRKKFEEGVFSDLRALKTGSHAVLENSRSPFLKFLHRNQCLRTQKKQKVFFWFSVPHNKLFTDVLERDLKRELANQPATTIPVSDVFKSFSYDQSIPLLEQLSSHFSSYLGKDVSNLIMKTNSIISSTSNIDKKPPLKSSHSDNKTPPQEERSQEQQQHFHLDKQVSDDFPLDFLESNSILNANYITSIPLFRTQKAISSLSPRNNSQYQILQQTQPLLQQQQDQYDGFLLSSLNQQIFLNNAGQQPLQSGNQPMFILSGLQSAIDPSNTLSKPQCHGRGSPMSNSFSQFVPVIPTPLISSCPSSMLFNGDKYVGIDQVLTVAINTIGHATYMNLQSSNLIPISLPLHAASAKQNIQDCDNQDDHLESKIDGSNIEHDDETSRKTTARVHHQGENENESSDFFYPDQRQDLIALSMPTNKMSFGSFGGQLFTPGTLGVEFNMENQLLGTDIGISPVIGFNSGMLSAIQYHPKKPLSRQGETLSDDESTHKEHVESKHNTIIENVRNSKVTKPGRRSRKKFLNPTLQHLDLDSDNDDVDVEDKS
ncbi:hypothetical protein CAS74_004448 [Pichia kudriavzevii]|uniref:Transcription factor CPH1 n=1 Tax=Pichia kudriavzevii TaxID=4909 RepID=A0A1Z8JJL5_PICKU|nr:hypothetical protein CAS74_004448 [Pichia kudriavzevii]